jgi:hypothetical protein
LQKHLDIEVLIDQSSNMMIIEHANVIVRFLFNRVVSLSVLQKKSGSDDLVAVRHIGYRVNEEPK